ncbi:MAG TPA: dockerin type I domain-containing protein, partial [Planctomycetota bacterium]|nr:dockerin type I domain-containing protein [Planctomycetota bacterium]
KLTASGQMAWSTFLGGVSSDEGGGLVVDSAGNVIVAGITDSPDFPLKDASDACFLNKEGFVAKFSSTGQLVNSSFLGGGNEDHTEDVAADPSGDVYVVSITNSDDFPGGASAPNTTRMGFDAAITRIFTGHWLIVRSTPAVGAAIAGTQPGLTDYVARCKTGETVQLSAAQTLQTAQGTCSFVRWIINGEEQPVGQAGISLSMNADHAVTAAYSLPAPVLTVQSTRVGSIAIGGDKPGTVPYSAVCGPREVVVLEAPAMVTDGGLAYHFARWTIDGIEQPMGQACIAVLADTNRTAVAVYSDSALTLTVESTPFPNAEITGDKPGTTNYTAVCEYGERVRLTASAGLSGDGTWYFVRWIADDVAMPVGRNTIELAVYDPAHAVAVYENDTVIIVKGPNELGRGAVPVHGTFEVEISLANIPPFVGIEMGLLSYDTTGRNCRFPISTVNGNPVFGGWKIDYNSAVWPSVFPIGSPGAYSFGIMSLLPDKSIGEQTWVFRITYECSDLPAGTYCIACDQAITTIANGASVVIPFRHVTGSVTIVSSRSLSVRSTPDSGIAITGDTPGTTPYTCDLSDRQNVTLTAPASTTVAGVQCPFTRWMLDGVPQPQGNRTLIVTADADHDAVAVYAPPVFTFNVVSSPFSGVQVLGDRPGTTPYAAAITYGQIVSLCAWGERDRPNGRALFVRWLVDGIPQPEGEATVTMATDGNHTIEAVYTEPFPAIYVRSDPNYGVNITGSKPGRTEYASICGEGEQVDLQAPESAVISERPYRFVQWRIGSALQPEGQLNLHVTITGAVTVTAIYRRDFTWFSVQSSPIKGVEITGDEPGVTPYTAYCDLGQSVTLEAPLRIINPDQQYTFQRWKLNGTSQAPGATQLTFTPGTEDAVVAIYSAPLKLTVSCWPPFYSVAVTGDRPGTTSYSASIPYGDVVSLMAPESINVSGTELVFACWSLDGASKAALQRDIQIIMDADHTATMNFHLPADISGNCSVNVLDLILLRNKLNAPVSQSDNWKADLNGDGVINVKDLLIMNGLLGKKCP